MGEKKERKEKRPNGQQTENVLNLVSNQGNAN